MTGVTQSSAERGFGLRQNSTFLLYIEDFARPGEILDIKMGEVPCCRRQKRRCGATA
jgi:hypothetical protein